MGREISVVTVGIGNWEQYTKPLIESWNKYASDACEMVVIDNHSPTPYPDVADVKMTRLTYTASYPEAINLGITMAEGNWYIVINNDVLFTGYGAFHHYSKFNPACLYSNEVLKWNYEGLTVPYPCGWHYYFHRTVLERVGMWDQNFKSSVADDLDYGWRCWKEGIPVVKIDMPLEHLEQKHHKSRNRDTVKANRQYFWEKHGFLGSYSGGG